MNKVGWLSIRSLLFLIGVLIITFFVYSPGLSGLFVLDDNIYILENYNIHIDSWDMDAIKKLFYISDSVQNRFISYFSFSINYYFFGLDPYFFKLINVVIHVLNGVFIFFLSYFILQFYRLECNKKIEKRQIELLCLLVAGAWLLHPLSLTSVLYISQRMNSLSVFFCLLGLVIYVRARLCLYYRGSGIGIIIFGFIFCFTMSILSKEIGVLLPFFMLLIEWIIFRFKTQQKKHALFLKIFFFTTVLLPTLVVVLYFILRPEWLLETYRMQDFSLSQRLLSEPRVLFFFIGLILVPNISNMGLFHDDIVVSHSLVAPLSTIFSLVGLLVLLVTAILFRKKYPIFSFGVLFFFIGHGIESSFIGLALGFEHRNYLPQYGIIFLVFYYIICGNYSFSREIYRKFLAYLYIFIFSVCTLIRANMWGDPYLHAISEAENHPTSAQANNMAGETFLYFMDKKESDPAVLEVQFRQASLYFQRSADLGGHFLGGMFNMLHLYGMKDRPIPSKYISRLESRLAEKPIAYSTPNYIVFLSRCRQKGECNLSIDSLQRIFRTTLANPMLNENYQHRLTVTYAVFLYAQANDPHAALNVLNVAVHEWPQSVDIRIILARVLIKLGKKQAASRQIQEIRSLGVEGEIEKIITHWENQLIL